MTGLDWVVLLIGYVIGHFLYGFLKAAFFDWKDSK